MSDTQTADRPVACNDEFATCLVSGLKARQKRIPSRFFYDARGSALFEDITKLPEYYPTRCEIEILNTYGPKIATVLPRDGVMVEFGSGSSTKTEVLLKLMPDLTGYVAIDVSATALSEAQQRLKARFPSLYVAMIVADFSKVIRLPTALQNNNYIGFFPGSTIGNFAPGEATRLLKTLGDTLGKRGHLVLGVDLYKAPDVLRRAYNDAAGVTAAFNKNVLVRANRELDTNFNTRAFRHHAAYDDVTGGVDMYLISTKDQMVNVCGNLISFCAGERIHTEHSHKYRIEEFCSIARNSGWSIANYWTDQNSNFAIFDLLAV